MYISASLQYFSICRQALACVGFLEYQTYPGLSPASFLYGHVLSLGYFFAVLRADFMGLSLCVEFPERTDCASFVEIIRVITAIQFLIVLESCCCFVYLLLLLIAAHHQHFLLTNIYSL